MNDYPKHNHKVFVVAIDIEYGSDKDLEAHFMRPDMKVISACASLSYFCVYMMSGQPDKMVSPT